MKHVFCALIVLSVCVSSFSQNQQFKSVNIGDPVPDVVFNNVLNQPGGKLRLADYKGKIIILDFWNRFCSVCIDGFPKMEKLQEQFKDKIQIILVTTDTREQLKPLFAKSSILKSTTLPMIFDDQLLSKLFPYLYVPYHVWIDKDGIARSFSLAQSDVTAGNIKKAINNVDFSFKTIEYQQDFDANKPLIVEGNGRQWKHLTSYYSMMRGIVGLNMFTNSTIKHPETGEPIPGSHLILNSSIPHMLMIAYNYNPGPSRNISIIVEGKHAEDFYYPENEDDMDNWRDTMSFSIECLFSNPEGLRNPHNLEKYRTFVKNEIEDIFQITGKIEKRKIECMVLRRIGDSLLLKSKGGPNVHEKTKAGLHIRNSLYSIKDLLKSTSIGKKNNPVVFDETGYDPNSFMIDIDLDVDLKNIPKLKKDLTKYGIELKMENREVECLIINDAPQANIEKSYTINATIEGLPDNTRIFLLHRKATTGRVDTAASTVVLNNHFSFEGQVSLEAEFYTIMIDTTALKQKISKENYIVILLDNSDVRIKGELANWPNVDVYGSETATQYSDFDRTVTDRWNKLMLVKDSLEKLITQNPHKKESYVAVFKPIENEYNNLWTDFISSQPNSLYTPRAISVLFENGQMDLKKASIAFGKLTKRAKNSFYGKQLEEVLITKNKVQVALADSGIGTAIGKKIPDFTAETLTGEKISLLEVAKNSRYTLVDFWASWCKPCRKQFVELKELYPWLVKEKISVITVNTDKINSDWKEASEKDKLPWLNVSDVKNGQSFTSQLFQIYKLPTSFLIDSKGVVVANDLKPAELEEFLKNKLSISKQ